MDNEQAIQDGLDILEMQRGRGWEVLKGKIEEESRATLDDLRRIDLEGRPLHDIGSDYVSRIQRINGLERIFEIVKEIEEAKENAENQS